LNYGSKMGCEPFHVLMSSLIRVLVDFRFVKLVIVSGRFVMEHHNKVLADIKQTVY